MIAQLTALAIKLDTHLSVERQVGYVRDIGDLGQERLRYAFDRAAKECEKFPFPATLRKLGGEYREVRDRASRSEVLHKRYLGNPDCPHCHGEGFKYVEDTNQGNPQVRKCDCVVAWKAMP